MNKQRLIPLIVATALFMENMDSTVIATSLPAIAADIGTSPLTLKLAITSYLLSLAVVIPAGGRTADLVGGRMGVSIALAVFMVGSLGCPLVSSVAGVVAARMVMGLCGALSVPAWRIRNVSICMGWCSPASGSGGSRSVSPSPASTCCPGRSSAR